jgi:tetratricopeptide (TPR) repeat protein
MRTILIFGFLVCSVAVFGQRAEKYFEKGKIEAINENYSKAIVYFDKAIKLDENDKDKYIARADAKEKLGEYQAALLDFNKAILIDPNYSIAYLKRGIIKKELKQYNAAIEDLDKAISIDPTLQLAYRNRGIVKIELKQYRPAYDDLFEAVKMNGEDAIAYNYWGNASYQIGGHGGVANAHNCYLNARMIDYSYIEPYYNLGILYYGKGEYEEALKEFQKVQSFNEKRETPYMVNETAEKIQQIQNRNQPNTETVTLFWINPNPDESSSFNSETENIQIKVKATKSGLNQSDFKVMVNNREMSCKLGERSLVGSTFSANVCLNTGNNEIKICYQNNCTKILNVRYQPQKPNLHILSIGPSFPDLKYTATDATDFANLFQGQTKLYNQRNINILKNDDATASKMKTEMSRLKLQYKGSVVSSQDVVIIFISSHGIVLDDDRQVRIKGADYDAIDKKATTVAFTEMIDRLDEIECKKIVFIDACFSGVLDPKLLASKSETSQLEVAKALKILTQKQNGWTIFSSSGNEVSWEHADWQNGAFTEAIIEGLKDGKADYDGNRIVTTTELYRYLNLRVPELNKAKGFPMQHPQMSNNLGNLPIFAY